MAVAGSVPYAACPRRLKCSACIQAQASSGVRPLSGHRRGGLSDRRRGEQVHLACARDNGADLQHIHASAGQQGRGEELRHGSFHQTRAGQLDRLLPSEQWDRLLRPLGGHALLQLVEVALRVLAVGQNKRQRHDGKDQACDHP